MFTNYIYTMSKLIKYSLYLILINFLVSHDCLILNQGDYGDCDSLLGYTWDGGGCSEIISGCNYNNITTGEDDSGSFYPTYEQCISNCFQHTGVLGDLNEDSFINVNDVLIIITFIILQNVPTTYEAWSSDLNSDGIINVVDIISMINIILAN